MEYGDLGKYIKKRREMLGNTLNNFAFENGIEPAILSRIENLRQGIKLNILAKIAKGFGKTVGEFLIEFENSKS